MVLGSYERMEQRLLTAGDSSCNSGCYYHSLYVAMIWSANGISGLVLKSPVNQMWHDLQALMGDIIPRTGFGSSYKEGRRNFQLQTEQSEVSDSLYPLGA
ncbi:cytochrome P450 72A397-like [Magnolia sinica]|uniref:cytochrome P450 72A397-like n=1 Tax=Magnolia sinica TaxID=86752 RepID=UPI00265A5667|nr:cytochrome P450 72A397-like [Magnolia sinica]